MASLIIQLIIDGLGMGLIYVMLSTGFNLIMGIPKILFVAYGQFYMIGAYITWAGLTLLNLPYFIVLPVAVIIPMILGALVYKFIFHHIIHAHFMAGIAASMGLMMILGQGALVVFGTNSQGMRSVFPGMLELGGLTLSVEKLVLIILTIFIIACLYFFLQKTKIGRGMRAVSFNADVAALQGVNSDRVYMVTMAVGSGLAGFAGGIMAPVYAVSPTMGTIILQVLLVVMLGGIGNLVGGALGGILLGLTLSFGYYFIGGGLAQIVLFVLIGLILFFRPQGLKLKST